VTLYYVDFPISAARAAELRKASSMKANAKHPKALDTIVDVVLAYRPKAKSKPARRRKRRAAKLAKGKA
jgi:hypothetical protein